MCARLALIPELTIESNDAIECQVSQVLQEVRGLLTEVQAGRIEPVDAANSAIQISSTANALHDALKYLNERLKLIYQSLSAIESILAERNP